MQISLQRDFQIFFLKKKFCKNSEKPIQDFQYYQKGTIFLIVLMPTNQISSGGGNLDIHRNIELFKNKSTSCLRITIQEC